MNPRNRASIVIARAPADVFAFVTDIDRIPDWNDLVTGVISKPTDLQLGAVWKVSLAQGPMRWVSRSTGARRLRAEVPTSLARLRTALDATDLEHTP